jgi:hypothetical protein
VYAPRPKYAAWPKLRRPAKPHIKPSESANSAQIRSSVGVLVLVTAGSSSATTAPTMNQPQRMRPTPKVGPEITSSS